MWSRFISLIRESKSSKNFLQAQVVLLLLFVYELSGCGFDSRCRHLSLIKLFPKKAPHLKLQKFNKICGANSKEYGICLLINFTNNSR